MKHLIVLNPCSLKDKDSNFKENLLENFKDLNYELYETTAKGSAITFLKEYFAKNTEEITRVYAVGGDGTLHEVVNGIYGAKNAELAAIPTGTGNDFVKIYGGQDNFKDIKRLINGTPIQIDLSSIQSDVMNEPMYSINVINFGFDAIVGARGNYYKEHGYPEKAKKKGKSPYDYALENDALVHGRCNKTVVYADKEKLNDGTILLTTLAQGQFVGGQFHCAPKSNNQDGLIDVCLIKPVSLIGLALLIGKYTQGHHLDKPKKKIIYRQAKEIEFNAPEEIDVCVDGEMIKGKSFTVRCVESAIKFVKPE